MLPVRGVNLSCPNAWPPSAPSADVVDSKGATVTLGQYNVKNWFEPEDADSTMGKRVKREFNLTQMARNIDRSGADVVTLNEVGTSLENVKELFDQKLPGKFPYIAMRDTNDARGIHVAVISRYPITNVVSHTDVRFPLADGSSEAKFSRDLLRVDIDVKGIPMTVYTTHAKSRHGSASNDPTQPGGIEHRIASAQATVQIMQSEMKAYPGRFYALMGDLNDNTDDTSVQAILNPPTGEKMFDTLDHLPEADRRTWPANPNKGKGHAPEQFDHIIVPESLRPNVVDSRIIDIPGISQEASDHLQIVATVNLPK